MLGLGRDLIRANAPLRTADTPLPLLLLVLKSSARFLTAAEQ